jgi:dTDP-4-dehydrorhamnose reductase
VDPVNYYGSTKAAGESMAMEANENTIIIRTSWVFSSHGNNFVKTMMRLMKERPNLNIVADQKGRPTYAKDLAMATMQMIESMNAGKAINGIYHYANMGETTWFDFAAKIKAIAGLDCTLNPIETKDFPTPAKRPTYSVLDTSNIEGALSLTIPHWEDALVSCIKEINAN